jgi:hypothetical protein
LFFVDRNAPREVVGAKQIKALVMPEGTRTLLIAGSVTIAVKSCKELVQKMSRCD